MRNAFAHEMTNIAKVNSRVVLLSGDIGNKLFDDIKVQDSSRFYNCGIAEANMMGVAAGLAMSGLRPFVYTIAPFTTTRCFEQVRVDVCYHNVPVVIVGTGSGLSYAELGPTHHSLEDMAIMRTLPGMRVLAPCDSSELREMLHAVLNDDVPTYIRIGMKGEPTIYSVSPKITLGKVSVVKEGKHVVIMSAGNMMSEALRVCDILADNGVSAEVVSFHTVKPLDDDYLSLAVKKFEILVTMEEHGKIGGFGSAVSEWCVNNQKNTRQLIFGTGDEFMHEIGSKAYARKRFNLTAEYMANSIMQALKDK